MDHISFFFFFQAEDGIRDADVTGVQTCALPISHPQRSLLLRAIDGKQSEPDLQLQDAHAGDRYLLCSDGLYTVVSAEMLREVMTAIPEPEDVVRKLVDLANAGGGPDNISCVVADVVQL